MGSMPDKKAVSDGKRWKPNSFQTMALRSREETGHGVAFPTPLQW